MKNKNHLDRFRHIHAHSSIYRHIQINSGIVKHIQELFRHVQNPVKPRHIQDTGTLRTPTYLQLEIYSEPCQISTMENFIQEVLILFKKKYGHQGGGRGVNFNIQ